MTRDAERFVWLTAIVLIGILMFWLGWMGGYVSKATGH